MADSLFLLMSEVWAIPPLLDTWICCRQCSLMRTHAAQSCSAIIETSATHKAVQAWTHHTHCARNGEGIRG